MTVSDSIIADIVRGASAARERMIADHAARYDRRDLVGLGVLVSALTEFDYSEAATEIVIHHLERKLEAEQRLCARERMMAPAEFYHLAPLYAALKVEQERLRAMRAARGWVLRPAAE